MTWEPDPATIEIAALSEAVAGIDGSSKMLFLEHLLGSLVDLQPASARLCASALCAAGNDDGQALGRDVLERLGSDARTDFIKQEEVIRLAVESIEQQHLAVDVLILTVKKVEHEAALSAFGFSFPAAPTPLPGGGEAWLTEYQGATYAIANIGTDGNVESALKTAQLFSSLRARLPVLVGMAAGVRGEVELGDVVVGQQVWAADFEKLRSDGNVPIPKTYAPRDAVWTKLATLTTVDPQWGQRVREQVLETAAQLPELAKLPPNYVNHGLPDVKMGVIFAGSRLVEDNSLVRGREERHGRLLAAEMEGAGFAASVRELGLTDWLVVRGVADFAEPQREKHWQFAATFAAAALVRDGVTLERITLPAARN